MTPFNFLPLSLQGLYRPKHIYWSIPGPYPARIQRNADQCQQSNEVLAIPWGRIKSAKVKIKPLHSPYVSSGMNYM